jgi:hypothetical protein
VTAVAEPLRAVPVLPGPAIGYPAIPGPRIPLLDALRCAPRSIYVEFYDPGGQRYGLPTYPYCWAPKGYVTRRQLRAKGLRPGGQQPSGQIIWRHHGRRRVAYLYQESLSLPVRPMSAAMWLAHAAAMRARMTCPVCQTWQPYCIPVSRGMCNDCAGAQGLP